MRRLRGELERKTHRIGDVAQDQLDLQASLQEIASLEASIGRTGLLALKPLNVVSDRDRWHRYLLDRS